MFGSNFRYAQVEYSVCTGTNREDILPDLRIIGFERRAAIAFVNDDEKFE